MSSFLFPENFVWGVATSSYQIEGAVNEGGRTESVWDTFCRIPGKIADGSSGSVACDHYHRFEQDTGIMSEMGLQAYRFSTAWPRIFPEGTGKPNPEGVAFYDRLIDSLLAAGIEPYVTLFHWDLPQVLEDRFGGWRNLETSKAFADYAAFMVSRYGDRVTNWMTMNEIACFTWLSHEEEIHAPGGKETRKTIHQMVHNALVGHGLATRAIRETADAGVRVGFVENLVPVWPVYDHPDHVEAARKAWRRLNLERLFPVLTGRYEPEFLEELGSDAPEHTAAEMKLIGQPLDFIGYNIYSGAAVRAVHNERGYEVVPFPDTFPKTGMNWALTPNALLWALRFTKETFGDVPVFITENGAACADRMTLKGEVLDLDRLEFFRVYLEAASRAISEGCNLAGYFAWSFMDNFEWSYGYSKRFGFVHVNGETQKRTIKLSGQYYRDVIRANRVL